MLGAYLLSWVAINVVISYCSTLVLRSKRRDPMMIDLAHALRSEPGVAPSWPRQILNDLCSLLNRTSERNLPHRP